MHSACAPLFFGFNTVLRIDDETRLKGHMMVNHEIHIGRTRMYTRGVTKIEPNLLNVPLFFFYFYFFLFFNQKKKNFFIDQIGQGRWL